jgi:hypothetical protein
MACGIEIVLLRMREHQHLPSMPRIVGATTWARCLHCGDGCAVEEGPDGEAHLDSCRGSALTVDCRQCGQ